ncbi:unnamed protein product [Rhizoctonia solani]|uniref:Peptidase M43 pregnancy-associated plasma-A domain-containing protein n=1 Tax=Rhizoctonia solani TaxID=456999 RepID=A0A8H2WD50_9AGAM|nr:unnamed protein product [Rhizoctonia solani]
MEVQIAEASFTAMKKASKASQINININITIPVYWHAIQSNQSLIGGHVPIHQINNSIKVLNEDFELAGFSFKLMNLSYVTNQTWFERDIRAEMKEVLRQGNANTLNIYSTSLPGLLGYTTLPSNYQLNPKNDGVVIRYSTVPGGTYYPFNLGKTLTHEVGHWLGLYHTFQGANCTGKGDEVWDTPAHEAPNFGCPRRDLPDTCPKQPGKDPIFNFMNYGDDVCLNEFTAGQVERMHQQFMVYRRGKP